MDGTRRGASVVKIVTAHAQIEQASPLVSLGRPATPLTDRDGAAAEATRRIASVQARC
jgi:hypothetical protein